MQPTVGFIGLGLMGSVMARRLLAAGYRVLVWNRTRLKAEGLLAAGAEWCESPAGIGARVPVVVTMLSTPEVVADIATQIRSGLDPGSIHVDCSTIAPSVTERLAALALAEGKGFVHAPVLGSVPQATDGSLVIFAGGHPADIAKVRPILDVLGKKVYEFADVARATNTKLLANFFIAGMIGTLAQGILFARSAGIDISTFLEILGQSALNAPMYQSKAPAMAAGDYTPRFYLEHMRKDIHLADASAEALGATMPYMPLLAKLFDDGMAMGLGKKDYSAVLEVLQAQSPKR